MTELRIDTLSAHESFQLLSQTVIPRPIAWTSTRSRDGVDNLAPFSYFTVASTKPAMLMLAIEPRPDGTEKDSLVNIRETEEFVVHVPDASDWAAVRESSRDVAPELDEAKQLGMRRLPSTRVRPSRLEHSKVTFECRLVQLLRPGLETLVIGEVLLAHLAPDISNRVLEHDDPFLWPLARVGSGFAGLRPIYSRVPVSP